MIENVKVESEREKVASNFQFLDTHLLDDPFALFDLHSLEFMIDLYALLGYESLYKDKN